MIRDPFVERREALEYEFCHRLEVKLQEELRKKTESEDRRKALVEATGITDPSVVDELMELDMSKESIFALSLMPLIEVAWSDGQVEKAERSAILQAAEAAGHCSGSVSFELLQAWLHHSPSEKLRRAWQDYMTAVLAMVSPETKEVLRHHVVGRARQVAESSGGTAGLHRVSRAEAAVISNLEKVFA